MAGTLNLNVTQGDTFSKVFVWLPGGVEADLAGYTARLRVSNQGGSTELDVTTSDDITLGLTKTIDGVTYDTGTITVSVDAATMEAIPVGVHTWWLRLTSGTGEVTKVLEGAFSVS